MSRNVAGIALVALLVGVPGACSRKASTPQSAETANQSAVDATLKPVQVVTMPLTDANVVAAVHELDNGVIRTSAVAVSRASSARVRSYAEAAGNNHKAIDSALLALARTLAITPMLRDSTLPYLQRSELTHLSAEPQADFDGSYTSLQIATHQRALSVIDSSLKSTTAPALRRMLRDDVRPRFAAELQQADSLWGRRAE